MLRSTYNPTKKKVDNVSRFCAHRPPYFTGKLGRVKVQSHSVKEP